LTQAEAPVEGSPYFEEILQPLGAHHILHLCLEDGGRPLGQLSLYRGRAAKAFATDQIDLLQGIARYVVEALRSLPQTPGAAPDDEFRDGAEGALVVCRSNGEILLASHRAHALLAHASGEPINPRTLGGTVDRKGRDLLRKLAAGISPDASLPTAVPTSTITNDWGRFSLSAYGLSDAELGVLIRRQEHFLVRLVSALSALPLSVQQREVAVLLARGLTNNEIARELGIALNTSKSHIKQIYERLDAHDRRDAIARILEGSGGR
jgi:DNA-binding CsgD family transcriptional regulator